MPLGGGAAKGAPLAFSYSSIAPMPFGTNEAQSVVLGDRSTSSAVLTPPRRPSRRPTGPGATTRRPTTGQRCRPCRSTASHSGIATDGVRNIYYAGGSASAANATQQVFGTVGRLALRHGRRHLHGRCRTCPRRAVPAGSAMSAASYYYFGGNNLTRTQDGSETWMLDVAGGADPRGSTRRPLPDPRNHIGFATIERPDLRGGWTVRLGQPHGPRAQLDRYDPATNTWTVLPDMPLPRGQRHGLHLRPGR